MKFKKGDKVKRIIDNFCHVFVGSIYTVDTFHERTSSITLQGLDCSYDVSKFELVEQEELINFLP